MCIYEFDNYFLYIGPYCAYIYIGPYCVYMNLTQLFSYVCCWAQLFSIYRTLLCIYECGPIILIYMLLGPILFLYIGPYCIYSSSILVFPIANFSMCRAMPQFHSAIFATPMYMMGSFDAVVSIYITRPNYFLYI